MDKIVGYCIKCRAKREMIDPKLGQIKNGAYMYKGLCTKCGAKLNLITKKPTEKEI